MALPGYARKYWGFGLMLVALGGYAALFVTRNQDPLGLFAWAWLVAGLVFLVLGQVSPIDVRYYLGLSPALALGGGYAVKTARESGSFAQTATWCGVGVALLEGVHYLTSWFGPVLPR
jgi:hypothetical protein